MLAAGLIATSARPGFAAEYDVVVYGGTSAGVMAAVQAQRMGKSVIIVCPDKHLGGLTSSGLGYTDTGDKTVIGGLAREFYQRIWQHYDRPGAWKWQRREDYGNKGQGTPAIDGAHRTMWIFEPHAAEAVFEGFIRDHDIPVRRDEWLDRERGVRKAGPRITSITTLSGATFTGRMFIDATYEGDLMAAAGVSYHVGREARSVYGEQWNGVQKGARHHGHHFSVIREKISPYVIPGDPASGVLPRISTEPPGEDGQGDHRVQAYCYRLCLTELPENRVPFPKPEGYDARQYELLARVLAAGWGEPLGKFDPVPNWKTDVNNHGPMSTDNIGFNYDYPEASYERRREILKEHEHYQKGWLWFLANDPRVPEPLRARMSRWGLARDEFTDNGHWPRQIYVREARRMIGHYIMTEHELFRRRPTPESVGMGSYTMDSHNVQRYITSEGFVENEGDIGVRLPGPYEIARGSLLPKKSECENLLVPVCVSSSHIAFGSIRMEPVFMILGQSAATAAALALDAGLAVQDLPYARLRARLLADRQILETSGRIRGASVTGLDPQKIAGVIVDDEDARVTGVWTPSTSTRDWIGAGYRHDGHAADGRATAAFETALTGSGRYEVRIAYSPHSNRARNVPARIEHSGGETLVIVDQRARPAIDGLWHSLGTYEFSRERAARVRFTNAGTDGHVIIDAVQWRPVSARD